MFLMPPLDPPLYANFVFQYICSFFRYLHHMTLVRVKLDVSGNKTITFQDCRAHWSHSFTMAILVCSVENLWKNLMVMG